MRSLQIVLILFWIALTATTVFAVQALGSEGGMVFVSDFSHPWRAQFNTDFLLHILLFCAWVFYREESKLIGVVAALCSLMGGLFTFPYLAFAICRAKGDARKFLLGAHA